MREDFMSQVTQSQHSEDAQPVKSSRIESPLGMGLGVGVALGIAIGVAFNNFALGIPIGTAIGAAIGGGISVKQRRSDD
jgi:uncharacterized membrane protein